MSLIATRKAQGFVFLLLALLSVTVVFVYRMGQQWGHHVSRNGKLVNATYANDLGAMKEAIKNGASPNSCALSGATCLALAASGGQRDAVKLLLEHGADVHLKSLNGSTPLEDARSALPTNLQVIAVLEQAERASRQ